MISSDRRSLLKGGAALAAWGAVGAAPLDLRVQKPALFIYDARFAASRALADQWAAQGVPLLDPRDHDLGLAWRSHIPALLPAAGGRIEGATLWSDRWVCETLARGHGLIPQGADPALPGVSGNALRQWVLA